MNVVHNEFEESRAATSSSIVWDSLEDHVNDPSGFFWQVSLKDLKRHEKNLRNRNRNITIPIMIMDSMLPRQRIEFGSNDKRFHVLVEHIEKQREKRQENKNKNEEDSNDNDMDDDDIIELGMIGLNPQTGKPLRVGVSVKLHQIHKTVGKKSNWVTLRMQGHRCFQVQGQPWMDDSKSFHMANVRLNEYDDDSMGGGAKLEESLRIKTQEMYGEIPELVKQWLDCLYASGRAHPNLMKRYFEDLGTEIPTDSMRDRAIWTAALINPIPALGVCSEIRPAMLACTNDYERICLAWEALHSSIKHLQTIIQEKNRNKPSPQQTTTTTSTATKKK